MINKIQNCCEIYSFDNSFFSHEIGTVTVAEIATVTEDDDPQSYEVNDVVAKMPQRAETCCNGKGTIFMLGGKLKMPLKPLKKKKTRVVQKVFWHNKFYSKSQFIIELISTIYDGICILEY